MKRFICIWGIIIASLSSVFAAKFSVDARVYPVGEKVSIEAACDDPILMATPRKIGVRYISDDGLFTNNAVAGWAQYQDLPFEVKNGKIVFDITFKKQQEHVFVFVKKADTEKTKDIILNKIRVYSLSKDNFVLRPYKGAFHMHSKGSDGVDQPVDMALECLKLGFDYMALSDHSNYYSSVKLIADLKKYPISMALYPAEEVHLNSCAHVQSFGAQISITDWTKKNAKQYQNAIDQKLKTLPDMPQESKYKLAQTCVAFDIIKANGGISVFNHPYWKPNDRTTVDSYARDAIYENFYCDAIEVVNDFDNDFYAFIKTAEVQAKTGKRINVVGNSDAHSKKNLNNSYTIILANSVKFKDLADAIRSGKSLAVENTHKDKVVFGATDDVLFAQFLEDEFFPTIKEIRQAEYKALEDALKGVDKNDEFKKAAEKIKKFTDGFWYKN